MSAKNNAKTPIVEPQVYVGRKEPGNFVRNHEEPEGDEFAYEVFLSAKKPTKKSHSKYNLVIGPFRTNAGAEVFRDRFGVNTIEEAERIAYPSR